MRHGDVGNQQRERLRIQQVHERARVPALVHARAALFEQRRQHVERIGLIVHHRDGHAVEADGVVGGRPRHRHHHGLGWHRQPDGHRRAQAHAVAVSGDGSAVLLDQVAGDGQAKAQAAVIPGRAAVGLPEAIEDVGQEVGRDADAGIANLDLERAATDVAVDA